MLRVEGLAGKHRDWRQDAALFGSWARGETGFPFVDACMRELASTGYMSNRGRQNVASFLAKVCLCWRGAERPSLYALVNPSPSDMIGNVVCCLKLPQLAPYVLLHVHCLVALSCLMFSKCCYKNAVVSIQVRLPTKALLCFHLAPDMSCTLCISSMHHLSRLTAETMTNVRQQGIVTISSHRCAWYSPFP